MSLKPVSFAKPRGHEPRLSKPYVRGVRSPKYWSAKEDSVVRAHYEKKEGVSKIIELLPHRSYGAIAQRANKLGLGRAGMSAKYLPNLPKDIDDRIRAGWEKMDGKKRGAVNEFADKLKVPRWWLSKRLLKLGLVIPRGKEPPWTAAELQLMTKVPLHDPEKCSKIFREHGFARTAAAIMVKAKRLHLSRRYTETFSATSFSKILGIDSKGVTALCIAGDLKAVKRKTRRLAQQGGNPWSITRADARAYIIDNLDRIDFRKVDKFELVDLLVRTEAK